MAAMKTVLALTMIFLIHQCVHFWGGSMAHAGVNKQERLQFNTAEEVSIQKKNGNFNNVRICNGKTPTTLAHVDGVRAVMCPRNNGGHVRPPAGTFNYTLTIRLPRVTSGQDGADENDTTTLVEIRNEHGLDPNVTVMIGETDNVIGVDGVSVGTNVALFN